MTLENSVLIKTNKIIEEARALNMETVSTEVLMWVLNNITNFIDNQTKVFKLDLIIDERSEKILPETKKLQDLYRSIPEDSMEPVDGLTEEEIALVSQRTPEDIAAIEHCATTLHSITEVAFENMKKNKPLLQEIFDGMSFYYELKGISKGQFLIQRQQGAVAIINFEYERFSVPVKITRMVDKKDGEEGEKEQETLREYTIPEGFTIWVEISLRPKQSSMTSVF